MTKKNSSKAARKRGQTSVEYILIIGVVVGVIAVFGKTFKDKISTISTSLFDGVDKSVTNQTSGG